MNVLLRTLLAALLLPLLCLPGSSAAPADGRVVVLGFDGADGRTAREMMDRGELPNLARLAAAGTFAPLGTTNPAESAAAWAALNTGQNPAKTGIAGFIRRDLLGGKPFPVKGFAEDGVEVPIEELGQVPIPPWSGPKFGAVIGGAALIAFLIVFGLLLRLPAVATVLLSVLLAAVGVWGGIALRGYLPPTMPVVKNITKTTPYWEVAGEAGVSSVVLDAAMSWDRPPVENVKILSGLGVPDASGDYMSYYVYTTDELHFARKLDRESDTGSGGYKLRVDERDGVIEGLVYGPVNFYEVSKLRAELDAIDAKLAEPNVSFKQSQALREKESELKAALNEVRDERLTVPLSVRVQDGEAEITIADQTQTIAEGEWSDWYRFTFELNPLIKVAAQTRVRLVHLDDPYFELYLNTVEIDPKSPPFWQPISQPPDFAAELAEANGTFETIGWGCISHPFKDGIIDPVVFMEDIEFTMKWREKMTLQQLGKGGWRLFSSTLSTPDRVQHMMYQFYDPTHPLYDAVQAGREMSFFGETIKLSEAVPAIYRQVDRIVGRVMEQLEGDDTLLICADHGFQSFRREVAINNWLAEKGYLTVQEGFTRANVLAYVDWSKTRAYSMGFGGIYVNLRGREGNGIVEPEEVPELLAAIRADFLEARDPENNELVGKDAVVISEVHEGDYIHLEPDMMLGFAPGYRVSWKTTTGDVNTERDDEGKRVLGPWVYDNAKNWSGDHISVSPELVKGMFFSSRPMQVPPGGIDLLHVAPTVLGLLDVPVPPEYDLAPLAPVP